MNVEIFKPKFESSQKSAGLGNAVQFSTIFPHSCLKIASKSPDATCSIFRVIFFLSNAKLHILTFLSPSLQDFLKFSQNWDCYTIFHNYFLRFSVIFQQISGRYLLKFWRYLIFFEWPQFGMLRFLSPSLKASQKSAGLRNAVQVLTIFPHSCLKIVSKSQDAACPIFWVIFVCQFGFCYPSLQDYQNLVKIGFLIQFSITVLFWLNEAFSLTVLLGQQFLDYWYFKCEYF